MYIFAESQSRFNTVFILHCDAHTIMNHSPMSVSARIACIHFLSCAPSLTTNLQCVPDILEGSSMHLMEISNTAAREASLSSVDNNCFHSWIYLLDQVCRVASPLSTSSPHSIVWATRHPVFVMGHQVPTRLPRIRHRNGHSLSNFTAHSRVRINFLDQNAFG